MLSSCASWVHYKIDHLVTATVADAIMIERSFKYLQRVVLRCSSACCTSLPGPGIGVSAAWLERSALSACWKSNCIATSEVIFFLTLARSRRLYGRSMGRAGAMALSGELSADYIITGRRHSKLDWEVIGSPACSFGLVRDSNPNEPPLNSVRPTLQTQCRHPSHGQKQRKTIESHQCNCGLVQALSADC